MSDTLISIDHVRLRLNEAFSLNIAALDVFAGEVLCLVGPTGSGKTTLLRLLTRLQPPDAGRIQYQPTTATSSKHSGKSPVVAMVHQRPLLLRGTVRKNLEYGLRVRNVPSTGQVDHWLARLGLRQVAMQDAATLSSGQTQLVALGRALIIEPDVLLLDEPTANLDPGYVTLVEQVIAEVHQERQLTVVWATHNLFQARRVADRVALLLNGGLVEVAPTATFFNTPNDSRVSDFVQGKMVY